MRAIGKQILDARTDAELSYEGLSKAITDLRLRHNGKPLRLSGAAIWRIETGVHDPKLTTLIAIAAALRVSIVITKEGAQIK